jgi:hypothetical protein
MIIGGIEAKVGRRLPMTGPSRTIRTCRSWCLGADGDAQHLVAEADAEGGDAASDDVADHRHRIFAELRSFAERRAF